MNTKSTQPGNGHGQSARDIERRIERTRNEMDQTLDELGERLQPRHLLDDALEMFQSHGGDARAMSQQARSLGKQMLRKVKRHPVPALLCAAGVAWFLLEDDEDEPDFHSQWADIPEHSGSFVDARTGEPYDDTYGQEWRGAAWSKDYDWSQADHTEEAWTQRAESTLNELKNSFSDATASPREKIRSAGARLMGISGRKRKEIHDQWANLREHSGSYVDARTGEPYDESYIRECEALMGCDFAASRNWSQEDEQSWSEKAQHALEEMQKTLSDTALSVKDRTQALASKLGEFMDSTGHTASSYGASVRRGAQRAYSGARQGAVRMGRQMRRGYGYSQHAVEDAIDEAPLSVGLACLGLGLVAGLMLPRTRREDRLMGETSDQLKRQVKDAGQEAYERGKHVAQATASAAMDEMDRQGLRPEQIAENVKQTVQHVTEQVQQETGGTQSAAGKVSSVIHRAVETAKEETRKEADEMRR